MEKEKIKHKIMEVIFFQELGRSRVSGRIYGFVPEIMLMFMALKLIFEVDVTWIMVLVTCLMVFVVNYVFGRIYDRHKLMEIETEFSNQRNPTLKKISEEIVNERKKS